MTIETTINIDMNQTQQINHNKQLPARGARRIPRGPRGRDADGHRRGGRRRRRRRAGAAPGRRRAARGAHMI